VTGFSLKVVDDAVDFLLRIGVLKVIKDQLHPGPRHVHLGRQSRQIWQHHANWRLAALQNFHLGRPENLHDSLVFSCNEENALRIRESLLEHLKAVAKRVESSSEEKASVDCFDFFQWASGCERVAFVG